MASTSADKDTSSKPKKRCSIDTRMILAKVAYILYGAIMGLHIPFLNEFFRSVGLSASEAGFISGIRFAASSVSGPMWGMIADVTGRRKLILAILCLGAAFPLSTMPWVARAINLTADNSTCYQGHMAAYENVEVYCESKKEAARKTLFCVLLLITMVGSMFIISLPGYIDAIVMNIIKSGKTKESYGAQRIFGSLGFGVFNFLGGLASDHYKYDGMSQYTAIFYLIFPNLLLMIPLGCYLINLSEWDKKVKTENPDPEKIKFSWENSKVKKVLLLFSKFDVSFFMVTVFISGLGDTLFLNFSFMLMRDEMNISKTNMTLTVVIATISEMLIFPFTSKLIRLLRGTSSALTLSVFTYLIRFLSMAYATKFWMMVILQSLHGVGFALAYSAMLEHTHKITPKEIKVTMFGILYGIFYSFSALMGNMIGGKVYDTYGGRNFFKAVALICGVWSVLMAIYYGGRHFRNNRNNKCQVNVDTGQNINKDFVKITVSEGL